MVQMAISDHLQLFSYLSPIKYTRTQKNETTLKMEALSLSPNISAKSLSNLTTKGSFIILRTSRFQNLVARFDQELAEILRIKEKASISKSWRFCRTRAYVNAIKAVIRGPFVYADE